MYKIGMFSKMTGITVKALRYYHDEKILIPKEVDPLTNYRLYTKEQVNIAMSIKLLRNCEFSMKEIKEILLMCEDLDDLPFYMVEKIDDIDIEIKRLKKVKVQINSEIKLRKVVKQMNEYEVIEKTLDSVQVVSIRYKGIYSDCGQYMGQLYKQAKGGVKDVPFNLYYDKGYQEEADIEVCVPVKKEIIVTGDVKCYLLPEKKGISVIHVGPYDTLGDAYQVLADYAEEKGLETKIPGREIYRKGPGMLFKGNTNKYVTEIFLEIE